MLLANRLRKEPPLGGGNYGEYLGTLSGLQNVQKLAYDWNRERFFSFYSNNLYYGTDPTSMSSTNLGFIAPLEAPAYYANDDTYVGHRFGGLYSVHPTTFQVSNMGISTPYTNRYGAAILGDDYYLAQSSGGTVQKTNLISGTGTTLTLSGFPDDEGSGRTPLPFGVTNAKGEQLWIVYLYSGTDSFAYIAEMNTDGSYAGRYFQCQLLTTTHKYLVWNNNEFWWIDGSNLIAYKYSGDT